MTKTEVVDAFRTGAKVGVIAGCFGAGFELVQYITGNPFFYTGMALVVYVIGFIIFVPAIFLFSEGRSAKSAYLPTVISLSTAYILCTLIAASCQVLLHYGIDTTYRETIAARKIERFEETTRRRERDLNATIHTEYNENEVRDEELAKYELQAILMKPVKLLPISLILACLAGLLVTSMRRAAT